jgi:uncharacterized protein (TIGR00255 family)
MIVSMTGFGRSVSSSSLGRLVVEIQSVNRKFLEISVTLPKEMSRFEVEVRRWVGDRLRRGCVTVRIMLLPDPERVRLPSKESLKAHKKAWNQLARACQLSTKEVTLPFLINSLPHYVEEKADGECLEALEHGVFEAMQKLIGMKEQEGVLLHKAMMGHLAELKKHFHAIRTQAPLVQQAMRQRIRKELEGLMSLDERVVQTIVAYAERADLSEELARLDAHCLQFQTLKEGRTLDFLVQEMVREINTIGSKSDDISISHLVVSAKGELEKIREQIQNIE